MGLTAEAQPADANYDEAKVPTYTLPDPLRSEDGRAVERANQWTRKRRGEVLELFREHVYGRSPGRPKGMRFEVVEQDANALGGKATRKQVTIWFTGKADGPSMDLLMYIPNARRGPAPAFLGLNFKGNHSVSSDPAIRLSTRWVPNSEKEGRVGNRATEAARGTESNRWAVERIVERGYALVTAYYGDLEPDFAEGWKQGVRSVFPVDGRSRAMALDEPIDAMAPDAWGAIGAWAWGLSRALDYLHTDRDFDAKRVAVMGHSRLGKTSLWAGAQDERFAIVISNNSGEGGAALARRRFGETTQRINTVFPHWFCTNFKQYNNREDAIPVDQHELVALAAPRPVYIASAEKDRWADPRGEFLAGLGAEPVYALFGKVGLGVAEMPGLDRPVGEFIGYHYRTGEHDVLPYDWERYMDFADRHYASRGKTKASRAAAVTPELLGVQKIWDEAPHSAFTDLVRHRGEFLCVFREGKGHVSPDGAVRVLASKDGVTWTTAAVIRSDRGDLRDPKIVAAPGGRLLMTAAIALPQPGPVKHQTVAWYSRDGRKWGEPIDIGDPNLWMWRVSWWNRVAYGIGYDTHGEDFVRLYRSQDGRVFETVVPNLFDAGEPNESSIVFEPDGTAVCLLRRDGKPGTGFVGRSRAPYTQWDWKDLGVKIGGPHCLRLPDGRVVGAVRLYDGGVRTSLVWVDSVSGKITEFLKLPSGGDTSYPGLVWYQGVLWVSYYSSHEGKTSIYVAKVLL